MDTPHCYYSGIPYLDFQLITLTGCKEAVAHLLVFSTYKIHLNFKRILHLTRIYIPTPFLPHHHLSCVCYYDSLRAFSSLPGLNLLPHVKYYAPWTRLSRYLPWFHQPEDITSRLFLSSSTLTWVTSYVG